MGGSLRLGVRHWIVLALQLPALAVAAHGVYVVVRVVAAIWGDLVLPEPVPWGEEGAPGWLPIIGLLALAVFPFSSVWGSRQVSTRRAKESIIGLNSIAGILVLTGLYLWGLASMWPDGL